MRFTQVTGPRAEPISLNAAKHHLRVDHTDDDVYISGLLTVMRDTVEVWRNECLVTQTWDMYLDKFPSSNDADIIIPRMPLVSCLSITYTDTSGTTQTFAASKYHVDTHSKPGRIYLAYSQEWPTERDIRNAVKVRFISGYQEPITVNQTTDVVTPLSDRTWSNGDKVRILTSGGSTKANPTGLSELTDYYVVSAGSGPFKLSATSGGTPVDITGSGVGSHYLACPGIPANVIQGYLILMSHAYEHREPVTPGDVLTAIPMSAEFLLDTGRRYVY